MNQPDNTARMPSSDPEAPDFPSEAGYAPSGGAPDRHKIVICYKCTFRKKEPRLSHTKCSYHRNCSKKNPGSQTDADTA